MKTSVRRMVAGLVPALLLLGSVRVGAQVAGDAQQAAEEAAKAIASAPQEQVAAPKPNYWKNTLRTDLTFLQNTYRNWSKGGINNVALSAYVDGVANYAKADKYWNNRLILDYGFLYNADKPITQKSKDRIYLESKWGVKASKTLGYTVKFDFQSQFANGYTYGTPSGEDPTKQDWLDARILKSGLLAPGIAHIGIGVDWNPNAWLTVNFSPLTGGFTMVTDELLRKNYGMERKRAYKDLETYPDAKDEDGRYWATGDYYRMARFELGTQLTANAKVKVNDNFDASTQLILFSNYLKNPQNIRVNWDTIFNWRLAKYFTLKLNTYVVYDDTVLIMDTDHPNGFKALQFYEALTFGFTYTFATKK